MTHTDILNRLITCFRYATYLEVGTGVGKNYENIKLPPGNKTGVDLIGGDDLPGVCTMSSDDFFLSNSHSFDLVFIDGLHYADQVGRDIINAMDVLNPLGAIVVHDLLPETEDEQFVPRLHSRWTGDCWKAWVRLRANADFSSWNMVTVDADHGCGIILEGDQSETLQIPQHTLDRLSWSLFKRNRNTWMNVISADQFASQCQPIPRRLSFFAHGPKGSAMGDRPGPEGCSRFEAQVWIGSPIVGAENLEAILGTAIAELDMRDPDWGVLGISGIRADGVEVKASSLESAEPVHLLDDSLLITQGSLPAGGDSIGSHLYGADLCMQFMLAGRRNYVLNVNLYEETPTNALTSELRRSQVLFRQKYHQYMPMALPYEQGTQPLTTPTLQSVAMPEIYYSSPYSVEKNLGRAYNSFMSLIPRPIDFGCLVDADAVFTTCNYGHLIRSAIDENPGVRMFTALTNRIGCQWQIDPAAPIGDDIREHRQHGAELMALHGTATRAITGDQIPGSGFFMLVRRDLWQRFKFCEEGMLAVDTDFFRRVMESGEPILQLQGLYVYHWYRGGNSQDISHLI
jgi:Methyltransferase domain